MKKIILIASLLMASGVYAEKLNVCYVYTKGEPDSFSFVVENINQCNDGDVMQFYYKYEFSLQTHIARYCNQDKQITLLEDTMGVCTLKLYSETKTISPEGPGAKNLREEMENDETLQKFLKVIKKGDTPRLMVTEESDFFKYLSKEDEIAIEEEDEIAIEEELRLREKPDQ